MKALIILGAVLAVTASTAAHANAKPKGHDFGGPTKQGKYCWVNTTVEGAGFWDRCDEGGRGISQHGRDELVDATYGGGGGGGGGGR